MTVTRQRLWQIRQAQSGRCRICGSKAVIRGLCQTHREQKNRAQRKRPSSG